MQITFFKNLVKIIILRRKLSHVGVRYKSKKVDDFSLSQKRSLVYK